MLLRKKVEKRGFGKTHSQVKALWTRLLTSDPKDRCKTRFAQDDRPLSAPAAHWMLTAPLIVLALGLGYLWMHSFELPNVQDYRASTDQPDITLLDYEGEVFSRFGSRQGRNLGFHEMSPWLPAAAVAIEDHRFYRHPGIDLIGLTRAMLQNLIAGRVVQGGSTISQQLAKLSYVGAERSLRRKLKEAGYALALEARLSKNDILEAYLNKVYLGGGAYGVDAASRRYFDKSASELTLAESAMLAGLIKAPSRYAPTRRLEVAQERASVVLSRMVDEGMISPKEAAKAKAEPASLTTSDDDSGLGYFKDWVAAESRLFSSDRHARLTVQTTLDRILQRHAESTVSDLLARYAAKVGASQVAMIAMTPDGRVKAMVGGEDYDASQFNRAVQAKRQPGSAFKLFLYLAALDEQIYPDNGISARPIEVDGWRPRNADDAYPDRVSIAHAFSHSVNTAAVRLAEHIGRDKIVQKARQLGITTDLHNHPSLALGSAEVTLLELTAAYGSVANGGKMVWPEGINSIAGTDYATLYRRQAIDERVLSPEAVEGMTSMLQETLVVGTGWRAQLPGFVAGKTGTSSDYRDAWFLGFTSDLVVGIWVGNDNGQPMKMVSGGGLPAMIFREFMNRSGQVPHPLEERDTNDFPNLPVAADQNETRPREAGFIASLFSLFGS